MKTLAESLLAPHRREAVVKDAVSLVETHVGSRGGLRGVSLKTGLAMLKTAKPGIVDRALQRLLPELVQALEPLYIEFRESRGRDFSTFLVQHSDRAAIALLAVSDAHAGKASAAIQSAYARLRSAAEAELAAAMPALSQLMRTHLENKQEPGASGPAQGE